MNLLQRMVLVIATSVLTALMVIGGISLLDDSADRTRAQLKKNREQVATLNKRIRLLEDVIRKAGLEVPEDGQQTPSPTSPSNPSGNQNNGTGSEEPDNPPPNKPKPPKKPPEPGPSPSPSPEECLVEVLGICVPSPARLLSAAL